MDEADALASVAESPGLMDTFDPAGLGDIRARFDRETTRRWTKTARAVKRAIVADDALGIGPKAPRMAQPVADKASMFKRWLDEQLMIGVVGHDAGWLGPHVQAAAARALALAIKDYDPDEPRDESGKWSSGSGGLVSGVERAAFPPHIQALKLPPAWTDVRINPNPDADLLAIGKDKKGRSQYVYSAKFQGDQSAQKFNRIAELESSAPGIAAKNDANRASSDPTLAEHADALHLIMQTGVRPGSEDDTGADKKAYGATTLEGRHVTGSGADTALQFVGKKGVSLNLPITNESVASMLASRAANAGPNGQLFPNVSDASLRDYVHGVAGAGVKVKDFRTLVGTSTARAEVAKIAAPKTAADRKKAIMSVAKVVSSKLGNTPTIALQSYIHPNVFGGWGNG